MSHRERAPEREEGAGGEDVAPLALFSQLLEREVHACPQLRTPRRISVREDAGAVLSKERIVVCCTLPWFQHFAALVPVDGAKRGVDSSCWIASVAQVVVEHAAFLEPDRRAAGVGQQPVHLGLEPASKDVPRVVGSVGQIRLGRTGFTVDLEFEIRGSRRVHDCDVEVEEVHLTVLMLVKFGWTDCVLSRWRALPFQFYIVVCVTESLTEAT